MKDNSLPTVTRVSVLVMIIVTMLACSTGEQELAATEFVRVGETAVSIASTQAVEVGKTALAIGGDLAATELVYLKETSEAAIKEKLNELLNPSGELPNVARKDNLLIGAYYYPWWGPSQEHWGDGYSGTPLLGEYDSFDQEVISKHIDWATGYGIDFFAVSWWGIGSDEDSIFLDYILKNETANDMYFAVLYEGNGLTSDPADGSINLDDPHNRQRLLEDFAYLNKEYFGNNRYLRVDGKPVVFIYLARAMKGDLVETFGALRSQLEQQGSSVYIVADEVYWQTWHPLDLNRIRVFDAVTAYNMHASVPDIEDNFTSNVSNEYSQWQQAALSVSKNFVPNVIPGFNDTYVRPEAKHPVINRSKGLFWEQLEMGLDMLDTSINMLLITSWNEWHEDTSIEPSEEYGVDYLEVLKEKLGH